MIVCYEWIPHILSSYVVPTGTINIVRSYKLRNIFYLRGGETLEGTPHYIKLSVGTTYILKGTRNIL